MRVVRAFSNSAPCAKQPFFHTPLPPRAPIDKAFLVFRRKTPASYPRGSLSYENWAICDLFLTDYKKVNADRSALALRVAGALAKLQDSESFRVRDLSLDKMMGPRTINYGFELAIIDLRNPLGIPPDTPKVPPIHDISLVADALSQAGLLARKESHIPRGGFVPAPRLHLNDETLGTVILTLPGAAPSSTAETALLASRDKNLLFLSETHRPQEEEEEDGSYDNAPIPNLSAAPSMNLNSGRRIFCRELHTSRVSLAKTKKKPYLYSPISPKPVPLDKPKAVDGVRPEWGLNDSLVHQPTFWRPGPEPLTLPARTSSSSAPPSPGASLAGVFVPPVRTTKAGIAYKRSPGRPKGFHTSARTRGGAAAVVESKFASSDVTQSEGVSPDLQGVDRKVLESRRKTMQNVQNAIRKAYGSEYKVENFGSTRYGVSVPSSDLDLVILDPHRPHGAAPGSSRETLIYNIRVLAKKLSKAKFKIIEAVTDAAVPIVKFKDPSTGLSCDLNVNERLGLLNSNLIKRYCELNPVIITMIQYIKLWAKPLRLNSPARTRNVSVTFSSYALMLMTIGFMQHRELLPNLQAGLPPLQPGKLQGTWWVGPPRRACCDVRYNQMADWVPPKEVPVPELMQDWFRFWGSEFDYSTEMMSIRQGGRLERLPRNAAGQSPFNGGFWHIDPFIRTKNLTANIGRNDLRRFQLECQRAANMPDFARGTLPRPKGPSVNARAPKPEALMTPLPKSLWIPVAGALPLPWREIPGQVSKTTEERLFEPVIIEDPVPEDADELNPECFVIKSTNDSTDLAPLWSEQHRSSKDFENPSASFTDAVPPNSEDNGFDFDPSLHVDSFGRIWDLEEPPRAPPLLAGEEGEQEDQVDFGLKSPSISSGKP
ncbi:hypothetical protein C8R46DRAFT_1076800 [Mycena filopes]|nr:hypothetical protein C8R46DRAFT_1076800 [Mycena filopes]